ncbi:MAG: type I-C CRISPR-associated protein Cas8c/Csd1 [Alphaproteobacteria bacterium]|nr:type I-C CRISPR-associated protein Cas8c/Csd1 [Alphaproteobacteria bacterium]
MSIFQSLNRAYERLSETNDVPPFGFSTEKIGFVISLNPDGSPAGKPRDIRDTSGKKPAPRMMEVPASFKRPGVTPRPFFLWDKSSYALGVSNKEVKQEHEAFVDHHRKVLENTEDEGLLSLVKFFENWKPEMFEALAWPEGMKDQNIVFALESERLKNVYLHDRPAAKLIWARIAGDEDRTKAVCLVTGERGSIARLHPAIKGVWGCQTAGGSIVAFNKDKPSFSSYGHEQGDNAPVSEAAAFAYTAVLNKFLGTNSNCIRIGDASVVFWADGTDYDKIHAAEQVFGGLVNETGSGGADQDRADSRNKIRPILEKIRNGESVRSFDPDLAESVRFYVLGLSPNAARISVRFWMEDTFGEIADNFQTFMEETRIEPADRFAPVALWQYLLEMAVQNKRENVPPLLAGQWMQAILSGGRYPQMLLSTVLMRIRADHTINARRVSILKSVLVRNYKMEAPVALDPENPNAAYHLGRLFAVYEKFQKLALGDINRTIRDSYFSAASTSPASVFPQLFKLNNHHRSKARKEKPGAAKYFENVMAEITQKLPPEYPQLLLSKDQGLFAMGYYHQFFYKKPENEGEDQ